MGTMGSKRGTIGKILNAISVRFEKYIVSQKRYIAKGKRGIFLLYQFSTSTVKYFTYCSSDQTDEEMAEE